MLKSHQDLGPAYLKPYVKNSIQHLEVFVNLGGNDGGFILHKGWLVSMSL